MPVFKTICVFSSSSDAVAPEYFSVATELGALIARSGLTLIYGGGKVGVMGAVATSVHRHGGRVIGVIPKFMRVKEVAYEAADELIVTQTMRERKAIMEARADAFVSLPGGFGTLEEILEILTLKQLHQHAKPIVFVNTAGFFDPLLELFERLYREQFTKVESRQCYHVAAGPSEVLTYLDEYKFALPPSKWF